MVRVGRVVEEHAAAAVDLHVHEAGREVHVALVQHGDPREDLRARDHVEDTAPCDEDGVVIDRPLGPEGVDARGCDRDVCGSRRLVHRP